MKEIRITAEELGKLLEEAYRTWLDTATLEEIVQTATSLTIGVYLEWWDEETDGTEDNLRLRLGATAPLTDLPHDAAEGPDFAGHLPYVPLVGFGDWNADIDDVLAEWGGEMPEDEDKDKDKDEDEGETSRVRHFETLLYNTPDLLPKARNSLARLIDDMVKEEFVVFAEVWLDAQRRKLQD